MSDCKNCKHLVMYDYKNKSYSCELGECEFEPEEQEPILDKIRAEISTVYESLDGYDPDSLGAFVSKIDEIFDRYKADREALADIYKPTLKADLCIMDEFAFMPQAESEEKE